METKTIKVEFEQVKVVEIVLDLFNLENYMSKFLALKNHERNTDDILEVSGWDGSNSVRVVLLIDEDDEAQEVDRCKDYAGQFGKIERCEVQTAWILNDTYFPSISSELGHKDWFVYGKH